MRVTGAARLLAVAWCAARPWRRRRYPLTAPLRSRASVASRHPHVALDCHPDAAASTILRIVEPYRRRDEIDEGHELRGRLAGWVAAKGKILYAARPAMPVGIEDRNADVWEALFAIADAAGGDWPKLAREAAVALIADGREQEPSLGIRLLADLRTVFRKTEAFFTEAILTALHALEEAPWKDLNGKGLKDWRVGAPPPPVRHQIEANPGWNQQ